MYDNEIKLKFIELRARSIPYSRIAADLNITKATLVKWGQRHRAEIDALAAIETEALREQYFGSRVKEVEVLSKRLARLEGEIDARNPQYMATRELTDLIRITRTRLDQLCAEPALPIESEPGALNPESQAA